MNPIVLSAPWAEYLKILSVGNPGRESNALWAIARGAHKKPTYAQMVKASNRVVSEVRKRTSN